MEEKIKCPECGSENIEPYRHSAVGASIDSEKPSAKGPISYECRNCGYEFTEENLNGSDRTAEYIQMCSNATELTDHHFFEPDDNFYVKNEVIHVVKDVKRDLLLTEVDAYPTEECYWIPTKSQLSNKLDKFIDDPDLLFEQFCNDKSRTWHYPHPKIYFTSDEKRWLALFMAERYKKFWNKTKKIWVKDPDF